MDCWVVSQRTGLNEHRSKESGLHVGGGKTRYPIGDNHSWQVLVPNLKNDTCDQNLRLAGVATPKIQQHYPGVSAVFNSNITLKDTSLPLVCFFSKSQLTCDLPLIKQNLLCRFKKDNHWESHWHKRRVKSVIHSLSIDPCYELIMWMCAIISVVYRFILK